MRLCEEGHKKKGRNSLEHSKRVTEGQMSFQMPFVAGADNDGIARPVFSI